MTKLSTWQSKWQILIKLNRTGITKNYTCQSASTLQMLALVKQNEIREGEQIP